MFRTTNQLISYACDICRSVFFGGIHQTFFLPKILPVFYVGKTMSLLPPMTGNGKHTTYKMVKLGMVYYCFANIAVYYIMWLKQ